MVIYWTKPKVTASRYMRLAWMAENDDSKYTGADTIEDALGHQPRRERPLSQIRRRRRFHRGSIVPRWKRDASWIILARMAPTVLGKPASTPISRARSLANPPLPSRQFVPKLSALLRSASLVDRVGNTSVAHTLQQSASLTDIATHVCCYVPRAVRRVTYGLGDRPVS